MGVDKVATAGRLRGWPDSLAAVRRRLADPPPLSAVLSRLKTISPYLLAMAALAVVLAFAAAPISNGLVQRWSDADVEARSRLIYRSIDGSLERAVQTQDWARVKSIFSDVALDDRVLAVGLCEPSGRLRSATSAMPKGFSCPAAPKDQGFLRQVHGGRPVSVGVFPVKTDGATDRLVVLHDLSFIGARSGEAQFRSFLALAALATTIVLAAAVLLHLISQRWIRSLRLAVAQAGGPPSGPAAPAAEEGFMDAEIRRVIRQFEAGRANVESQEVEWSPAALQGVLKEALPGAEVLVLSNREPYIHNHDADGRVILQTPASGLVSALEPVMRATGGTWIAHGSGGADREMVDANDVVAVPPSSPSYKLRRLWITEEEQDGYYYGFANEGLWPLCHIAFVRPVFRESDWRAYQAINQRFADAAVQEARTEDPVILVQDYHLALAPRMIREKLPKATIVTFWHIPWPNSETFGVCPWKDQIVEGLLGSTILGFHTQFHCNNFLETVDRFLESRIDREESSVSFGGRETLVRPYPISIAWPPRALIGQRPVEECRAHIRQMYGLQPDARIAVGIERFDYTKGVLDRMQAVDNMLEAHPEWRGKFVLIQAAAPTRSKLPSYGKLQDEARALAEQINARHGGEGYQPVHLSIRHHEPHEVFELFRAADLCVVSSLHDGMNLVAKEFVAARDDEQGVLVLSSFAGASRELGQALIVNPYNPAEMAQAFDQALQMPPIEQRERIRLMREQVRARNVYRWAGKMLLDCARTRQDQRIRELASQNAA
jgi:trehalose 6-phosphate synthase